MPTARLDPVDDLDHLAHLVELQGVFAATIPTVDPRAPVPSCGSWRVRGLVVHLAAIHRWAAAEAAGVREVPPGRGTFGLERLYRDCAAELRTVLTGLGPDAVGRTLDGAGPASFWRRRQLHETLVHLWDLRTAGGRRLDVAPGIWADTVDEVITVMQPRQVRLGRMAPLRHVVDCVATDVPRRWRLDRGGGAGDDPATADAAVTVSGPTSALALLLWRRVGPDDDALTVTGDDAVLRATLAQPLTP